MKDFKLILYIEGEVRLHTNKKPTKTHIDTFIKRFDIPTFLIQTVKVHRDFSGHTYIGRFQARIDNPDELLKYIANYPSENIGLNLKEQDYFVNTKTNDVIITESGKVLIEDDNTSIAVEEPTIQLVMQSIVYANASSNRTLTAVIHYGVDGGINIEDKDDFANVVDNATTNLHSDLIKFSGINLRHINHLISIFSRDELIKLVNSDDHILYNITNSINTLVKDDPRAPSVETYIEFIKRYVKR